MSKITLSLKSWFKNQLVYNKELINDTQLMCFEIFWNWHAINWIPCVNKTQPWAVDWPQSCVLPRNWIQTQIYWFWLFGYVVQDSNKISYEDQISIKRLGV